MPFPWRPGTRVTGDRLNEHLAVFATKSANETRTSTTVTADGELIVTLAAGSWEVEFNASVTASGSSPAGIIVQWLLGGAASLDGFRINHGPGLGSTSTTSTPMRITVNSATTNVDYGGAGGFGSLRETARVIVGSGGGTVALGWARNATATNAQLGGGSWISARRYA